MLGPLLSRFRKAKVAYPGGCAIGARPINLHLKGFEQLGAKITEEENHFIIEAEKLKGNNVDINFGSQIRSYVMCPYTLVKDHRTGFEAGNINAVMDGDIDGFINAYLKMNAGK